MKPVWRRLQSQPLAGPLLALIVAAFAARAVFLAVALPFGDPHDELFHVGYAEFLAKTGRPPGAGGDSMPEELLRAASILPGSNRATISWGQFSRFSDAERRRIRAQAFAPPPAGAPPGGVNYESQQPPLAYVPAAILCRWSGRGSAASDVLLLRFLAALLATSAVPLFFLAFRCILSRREALAATAACAFFPGLGIFAGRWTNDSLALPLAAIVLLGLFWTAWGRLTWPRLAALSLALAAGLWTKLYFLSLVPAVLLAALLSPRPRRAGTLGRACLATGLALASLSPWLLRQRSDAGSWLGAMASNRAVEAGIGWGDRLRALPGIFRLKALGGFALSFLWPGTSAYMGPAAPMRLLLVAGIAVLWTAPFLTLRRRPASRRTWLAGFLAVACFLAAQTYYDSTFLAAIRRSHLREAVSRPGWYLLILLPVILTAGLLSGRRPPRVAFAIGAAMFFAADLVALFGLLPAVYSGAGEGRRWLDLAPGSVASALASPLHSIRVYGQVGLGTASAIAVLALGWIAVSLGALFRLSRAR